MEIFGSRLKKAIINKQNAVCVGLDPRLSNIPEALTKSVSEHPQSVANIFEKFCFGVIDAVAHRVAIVKPQVAFFERYGPHGMAALQEVIRYAHSKDLLVISDAKRSDIGTTAEAYADAYLGSQTDSPFGSDALTVNPFLGCDTLEPFTKRAKETGSGVFVLVKTSNAGSGFIQDIPYKDLTVSDRIADWIQTTCKQELNAIGSNENRSNSLENFTAYGSIGAVVGATYPEQLIALRERMKNAWLLIPGYGAQGGSATDLASAFDSDGLGAIVNNSRGIIFAHTSPKYSHFKDWQQAVEQATVDMIDDLRAVTNTNSLYSN